MLFKRGAYFIFSQRECLCATPKDIKQDDWNKLLTVFDDKKSAIENNLVTVPERHETCEKVFEALTLEAEAAGLHGIP